MERQGLKMAKGIGLFFFFSSPETLSFLIWKRLEF